MRIAHDLMSQWKHQIIQQEVKKKKKKKEKVRIYKQLVAHDSRISQDSISLNADRRDSSEILTENSPAIVE